MPLVPDACHSTLAFRGRNDARMRAVVLFGGLGAAIASAASADPICADRPGKATSACTVPDGHWQVETGLADWSLQKDGGERDTSLTIGATTFKYGISDSADVEVAVTPWERQTSSGPGFHDSASGVGDVDIIYKQRLTAASAPAQLVAMPFVKLPVAKQPLGNGEVEAGLKLPVGYSIPKTPLSLGLTPELDWAADADGHGHHAAMVQVASIGWAVTHKFTLSGELWHQWDWDPAGTTRQASADAAAAYDVNDNLQLDGGANFGLNRATPDIELYAGVSKRF